MKTIYTLFTTILLLFSSVSFAQHTASNSLIKTVYSYSFLTETSTPSIYIIEQEIKLLTGVTEVKIKIKTEKNIGQLIVVVKEKKRTSEGDVLFQPTDLKRILSTNGFTPNELTTEVFTD